MTKFSDLVDKLWAGTGTDTARAIAHTLKLNATQQDVLLPVIADAAQGLHRQEVRVREERAFSRGAKTQPDLRDEFLRDHFPLGDGTTVSWAEATPAQHRKRVAFLAKLAAGINDTIARHEKSAAFIEEKGVTCLGDLDPDEVFPIFEETSEASKNPEADAAA